MSEQIHYYAMSYAVFLKDGRSTFGMAEIGLAGGLTHMPMVTEIIKRMLEKDDMSTVAELVPLAFFLLRVEQVTNEQD